MAARKKYNWEKLKAEFIAGDWLNVTEFFRDKNIPMSNSSKTVGWGDEKQKYEKEVLTAASKKMLSQDVEDITKVRSRQARLAKFMQLKGMNKLQTTEVNNLDEARKLMVSGMQEERRALGMEGNKQSLTQINIGGPKTNLDKLVEKLDYEGLLGLIAQLKRERARRTLPDPDEQSVGTVEEGRVE